MRTAVAYESNTVKPLPVFPSAENSWAALLERPQFVIDDTGDADDDEISAEAEEEGDEELLASVDNFLSSHGEDEAITTEVLNGHVAETLF